MTLLRTGCRVRVEGELTVQQWEDRENGASRFGLHIDAESCDLRLNRIDEIRFRAKRSADDTGVPEHAAFPDEASAPDTQKKTASKRGGQAR